MSELDWDLFFQRYGPVARRFAAGLSGDGELAGDLFQEAAQAVLQRARSGFEFESAAHLRNYLFKVLRNLAVDARRGPRPPVELEEVPDPAPGPEVAAATAQRDRAIAAAVDALRVDEREVLRLRYLEGRTFREIAERTGTSISTLHSRAEAALARVRNRIGKLAAPP